MHTECQGATYKSTRVNHKLHTNLKHFEEKIKKKRRKKDFISAEQFCKLYGIFSIPTLMSVFYFTWEKNKG